MSDKKEWQGFAAEFKELLGLEYSPLAVNCLRQACSEPSEKKLRICRSILDAGKGAVVRIGKKNNACFGASWHLGFEKISDEKVLKMIESFVVEGEKLFCSYEALDNLLSQMPAAADNADNSFLLSPMEKSDIRPDLVIFICNAEGACRLLTLVTFLDGVMPKIKIGGPTCAMSIIYPLITGEVNLSFYDYTARKMCNVEKDKLLVSIPYIKIPLIVDSIDRCTAGRAKMEYPAQFREFLQKRLTQSQ